VIRKSSNELNSFALCLVLMRCHCFAGNIHQQELFRVDACPAITSNGNYIFNKLSYALKLGVRIL